MEKNLSGRNLDFALSLFIADAILLIILRKRRGFFRGEGCLTGSIKFSKIKKKKKFKIFRKIKKILQNTVCKKKYLFRKKDSYRVKNKSWLIHFF